MITLSGTAGIDTPAIDSDTFPTLAGQSVATGFRNRIINGDMRIAQRGTSGALTTSFTYLSCDRWAASQGGSANGILQQNAAVTNLLTQQFQYAIQLGRNASATTTGGIEMRYMMEDKDVIPLRGQSCTFSFYYRKGSTLADTPYFYLVTGTAANESVTQATLTGQVIQINNPAISAWSTTWQRASATFTMPTNALGTRLQFGYTPTGTAGADDFMYITGVQLEAGSVATPFESRPVGVEELLCARYLPALINYGVGLSSFASCGINSAATGGVAVVRFDVPVRVAPTGFSYYGSTAVGNLNIWMTDGNVKALNAFAFYAASTYGATFTWGAATSTNLVAGGGSSIALSSGSYGILLTGCEL